MFHKKQSDLSGFTSMIFSSLIFLFGFLGIILAVYFLLKPLPIFYRNFWLFVVSIFFYAWGEPKFFVILLGSIFMNYLWGLAVDKFRSSKRIKWILVGTVTSNLIILFIFKYLNFFSGIINSFGHDILKVPIIFLPIGISFFTFQAISYVIDVYRGHGEVQKNPLNVGLYISFFPQLIAGPIVRYDTVAGQIRSRRETMADFAAGIERFLIGFCKKILLANTFAQIADISFDTTKYSVAFGADLAWLSAIAYALQILFDFSGYSDMAIGLGKMFGFHFNENFDYPYMASSVSDFWRRWHISLGSWFRDYVYIPLGGSRVTKKRLIFNLFVVWTLTGIWHGANWTFIIWGMFYFVLLTLEKLTGLPGRLKSTPAKIAYRLLTLLAVLGGWIVFRSESLREAYRYLKVMFGFGHSGLHDPRTVFYLNEFRIFWIFGLLLCIPVSRYANKWLEHHKTLATVCATAKPFLLFGLFIVSITYLIVNEYNPFIYFNF